MVAKKTTVKPVVKRVRQGSTGARPPKDETLERVTKAVVLRTAGATYDQIAHTVGYSDRSNARAAVIKALEEQQFEAIEQFRTLQGIRYERLIRALWSRAVDGDLPAYDRVVDTLRDYNRLMGANMPTKLEVTDEMDREINALVASLTAGDTWDITTAEEGPR